MNVFYRLRKLSLLLVLAACAGPNSKARPEATSVAQSRGVQLKKSAQILFGSSAYCSQPATVDLAAAQAVTPEGRTIESNGILPGSARYRLLHSVMHKRVVAACAEVARDAGFDLVVRHDDILDARGLAVSDMTLRLVKILRDAR